MKLWLIWSYHQIVSSSNKCYLFNVIKLFFFLLREKILRRYVWQSQNLVYWTILSIFFPFLEHQFFTKIYYLDFHVVFHYFSCCYHLFVYIMFYLLKLHILTNKIYIKTIQRVPTFLHLASLKLAYCISIDQLSELNYLRYNSLNKLENLYIFASFFH